MLGCAGCLWLLSVTLTFTFDIASSDTVERKTIAGVDVVIRIPGESKMPRGIVLALHGCSHGARDWGTETECAGCIGLPEELQIARSCIEQDFIVVAPSSQGHCWSHDYDGPMISEMLNDLLVDHRDWRKLPLLAFGASSGGAMALLLSHYVAGIKAIAVQIMAVPNGVLSTLTDRAEVEFPPTLYLHMARDERTREHVSQNMQLLAAHHVKVKSFALEPQPLTEKLLRRIDGMLTDRAATIIARLQRCSVVDEHGWLQKDPRASNWRQCLNAMDLGGDSLEPDRSPLSELLNVAWAQHEIFSDASALMVEWFNSAIE
eukprot:m.563392 g.563392  ORF g.563392 m.563392 type:complete len:318 (+) comp22231_c1_seq1:463-1416(+)